MSYNITIRQGATFQLQATVQDSAGDPVDLTGFDARMQVRTDYADNAGTVLVDLTLGDGVAVPTPANGVIVFTIDADATEDLPGGRWRYDAEIESSGGVVTRILEGAATVSREVTREVSA